MRISEHVTYWNDLALKVHQSKPLDIVAVVPLPDDFQLGSGSGHHLILFAQEPLQGAVVGAATMPL